MGALVERSAQRVRQARRHDVAESARVLGASTLTEHIVPTRSDSMRRVIDSSTAGSGALAVSFSKTSCSAAATLSCALALGDVRDAAAHEPARAARQAHEAHFAHDLLAERVPMQPLEHLRPGIERALDARADLLARQRAVRLHRRAAARAGPTFSSCSRSRPNSRSAFSFTSMKQPEIRIEHDDGVGRVIHEQPIARFALAHRLLGLAPLGDVAQTDHVHLAAAAPRIADRDLERKRAPVLAQAPGLARGEIHVRVAGASRRGAAAPAERFRAARSCGISRSMRSPTTSASLKPNTRSPVGLKVRMTPSSSTVSTTSLM